MNADRLRRALAGRPISRLDVSKLEAGYRVSPGALREAAVLVPVYFHADGAAHVLMTRRRNDLRLHPGQISWPGGRIDPGDADSLAAALREAHEEIGLAPEIDEIFTVPVARLRAPDAERQHLRDVGGTRLPVEHFPVEGHIIWGATHRITRTLLGVLAEGAP